MSDTVAKSHQNIRLDIQGLRAIALIAVVLCHMNPAWLTGGYLGTEFFVITGFVIAQTIFILKALP